MLSVNSSKRPEPRLPLFVAFSYIVSPLSNLGTLDLECWSWPPDGIEMSKLPFASTNNVLSTGASISPILSAKFLCQALAWIKFYRIIKYDRMNVMKKLSDTTWSRLLKLIYLCSWTKNTIDIIIIIVTICMSPTPTIALRLAEPICAKISISSSAKRKVNPISKECIISGQIILD